jgi:hypothetical protein
MYVANVGNRERMERAPVSDGTTLLPSLSSTSTYVQMGRREKGEEVRTSLSSLLLIAVTLSPNNTYERAGRGRTLCSLVEPCHFSHNFWEGVNCTTPPKKRNLTPHNFWEGVNCATHKKKLLKKKAVRKSSRTTPVKNKVQVREIVCFLFPCYYRIFAYSRILNLNLPFFNEFRIFKIHEFRFSVSPAKFRFM